MHWRMISAVNAMRKNRLHIKSYFGNDILTNVISQINNFFRDKH